MNKNNNSARQRPRKPAAVPRAPRLRAPAEVRTSPRTPNQTRNAQLGASVRTRLIPTGMSDIKRLRIAATIGYIFVGDGTRGAANAVLFQSADGNYLCKELTTSSSGQVPIALADPNIGKAYVADIEKHFSRKVIHRMWLHIMSLQPSTQNSMMAVVAPSRGASAVADSTFVALATATAAGNTVDNVSSMKGAFSIDSWETKTVEITDFIAGGTGARQNEFQIDLASASSGIVNPPLSSGIDGEGIIPACIAVAGNNATAALQNTRTHQVIVEQEVDLLDYVGGMALIAPSS